MESAWHVWTHQFISQVSNGCNDCGTDLSAGKAVYDRVTRSIVCVGCAAAFGVPAAPTAVDVRDDATNPDSAPDTTSLLHGASGTADSFAHGEDHLPFGGQQRGRLGSRWPRRQPDTWARSTQQAGRSA